MITDPTPTRAPLWQRAVFWTAIAAILYGVVAITGGI